MVQNNLLTLPFSRTLLGYCQSQRDIMLRLIFDIVSFKKGKTLANSYIIARDLRESISIKGNLTTLSLCHGTLGHAMLCQRKYWNDMYICTLYLRKVRRTELPPEG